jgi:hypothetical protein
VCGVRAVLLLSGGCPVGVELAPLGALTHTPPLLPTQSPCGLPPVLLTTAPMDLSLFWQQGVSCACIDGCCWQQQQPDCSCPHFLRQYLCNCPKTRLVPKAEAGQAHERILCVSRSANQESLYSTGHQRLQQVCVPHFKKTNQQPGRPALKP